MLKTIWQMVISCRVLQLYFLSLVLLYLWSLNHFFTWIHLLIDHFLDLTNWKIRVFTLAWVVLIFRTIHLFFNFYLIRIGQDDTCSFFQIIWSIYWFFYLKLLFYQRFSRDHKRLVLDCVSLNYTFIDTFLRQSLSRVNTHFWNRLAVRHCFRFIFLVQLHI